MDKIELGYIFRIDDITPGTNRENFEKIEKIFDTYGVKPIIGVVPNNQDMKLEGYGEIHNFRDKIKQLKEKGRIIAQHGYQHIYITKNSGIIGLNSYSEFAGLTYKEQLYKIKKGKEILEKNIGKKINRRMAPAHSFDKNTCKVLVKTGFKYITDGIAVYPFKKYGLKWLPQQIWQPEKKKYGIWTICLHINKYEEKFIHKIDAFIKENKQNIIIDPEVLDDNNNIKKQFINKIFKAFFWSKIYIYKIKKSLLG